MKKLAFVNLPDESITYTCITSKNMVSAFRDYLVWSQDNSKLAVKIYSENGSSVTLVDILSKSYKTISSGYDLTPMGWLNFKPEINE